MFAFIGEDLGHGGVAFLPQDLSGLTVGGGCVELEGDTEDGEELLEIVTSGAARGKTEYWVSRST